MVMSYRFFKFWKAPSAGLPTRSPNTEGFYSHKGMSKVTGKFAVLKKKTNIKCFGGYIMGSHQSGESTRQNLREIKVDMYLWIKN